MQTINQAMSAMYPAFERGIIDEEGGTTYCTLNYKHFFFRKKRCFFGLNLVNETMVMPLQAVSIGLNASSYYMFIPLNAEVLLCCKDGYKQLHMGELGELSGHDHIEMVNSVGKVAVNILWIELLSDSGEPELSYFNKHIIPLGKKTNEDVNICQLTHAKIVRMDKNEQMTYLSQPRLENGIFCFNLIGSLAVAGQILAPKDGLGLWAFEKVNIEALLSHSVFLLIEDL